MMKDFFTFKRMLAPILIHILFWIGVIAMIGTGLLDIFTKKEILKGIEIIIIGPIVVRLAAEMLILFFRMNETLTDINNKGGV